MKENNLHTHRAIANEKILVETKARFKSINQNKGGKLVLTDKKLLFLHSDSEDFDAFDLRNIHSLSIKKSWGIIDSAIFIAYEKIFFTLKVEYPRDWKRLIEKQISKLKA